MIYANYGNLDAWMGKIIDMLLHLTFIFIFADSI